MICDVICCIILLKIKHMFSVIRQVFENGVSTCVLHISVTSGSEDLRKNDPINSSGIGNTTHESQHYVNGIPRIDMGFYADQYL
jgi:hypothetical protein